MSVFISYSRQDAAYVTRLAEHLRQAGLPVWLDTERIDYGDRWEHVIQDQVDRCTAMIVVMSPAAEASPHVGNELQRARELGKRILPVLLAGEGFFALGTSHRFDARSGRLPDERFLALLRGPATRQQLVVGDPPRQAVAWQDRPGLLDGLVRSATAGTSVVCALAGQRGVGKTQLAAAYAQLRIQHGWPVVVWAVAETEAGLISALDELAGAAGVREPGMDPQEAARAGLRWLRAHPGPCLLVYDNATDPDLIDAWTPSLGTVHTVVTTTRRELDALGPLVDVALFTAEEAAGYLRRRTGDDDLAGARELAEHLGRLPLALAQAGALIGRGRRYPDYRKYLAALASVPTERLLPRTPGDPYPLGIAEALLLSLDDLTAADPDGHARRLLDRLAVLSPAGADPVLLDHLTPGTSADELVAALAGRSLVISADRVVVHRVIQRVVRERAAQAGTLAATVAATAEAVGAASSRYARRHRDRALLSEYAEHIRVLLANSGPDDGRTAVIRVFARIVYRLNEVHSNSTVIAVAPALIAAAEQTLGAGHDTTLSARNNVAVAYRRVGRLDDAIELHTRTLADRERVQGPEHPDTLISRQNLATAYRDAGRLDEALDLDIRTLADCERILGPEHPDTLLSRNNVAVGYRSVQRLDEAIAMHTRNIADRERILGPRHPDTLMSRSNLAAAYREAGRFAEAIAMHTGNLVDLDGVLGPDHPDTLTSRHNLAVAYRDAGRLDEAIDLYARTVADRERVLGPEHPRTRVSRRNLAAAYRAAGRHAEADALGRTG